MFAQAMGRPLANADVSYLEVGLYVIQQQGAIIQASPLAQALFGGTLVPPWSRELFRRVWPVPAALAFKTTDGHWIQHLGVDTGTHLPKLLGCLGHLQVLFSPE